MLARFALRDASIAVAASAAWWLLAPWSAGAGPLADAAGVVAGLLVGAVAFVLHEWGHLLAGLAVGGAFPASRDLGSPFLFQVDPSNSVRQFTVMSLGGFAVSALVLVFLYTALPEGWMATRVARGVAVFLASLTVFLEVPLLLVTIARGAIPEVASVATSPADPDAAA